MSRNLCILLLVALLEMSQAQRPSFAGMRPPDGLSQKDKYLGTQNTGVENFSGLSIGTRFGEDTAVHQAPINLPFGASQKPPVGVDIVLPVSNFASNPVQAARPSSSVNVATRFDQGDVSPPSSGSSVPTIFSTATNVNRRPVASSNTVTGVSSNALPIDAHGDQQLVNHLNSLPEENRPFWFLNYQAIEALRNSTNPNVNALENRGSSFQG